MSSRFHPVVLALTASITAFTITAHADATHPDDTTRQEVIRQNSVGTGSADRAIEQDRANRRENSQHNEVTNATSFLNNLQQRQQERNNRAEAAAEKHEQEVADLKAAEERIQRTARGEAATAQFNDIPRREPVNWSIPNAGENAWIILQYCNKEWDADMRDHSIPCALARAKFVLGINGRGVYQPDPKAALKELKSLLKEDIKEQKQGSPRWDPLGAEILNYMGEAYFVGLDFPESKIKQDFGDARDYFEQSIRYGDLAKADFSSRRYQVASYIRLIEIHSLGLGTDKNPEKANALAKEVASFAVSTDRTYLLTESPEWPQVKDIVAPYLPAKK